IEIKKDSRIKYVKPDVVVTLGSHLKIGEMKKIEFQVKIYEQDKYILSSHIKTSKELLKQQKIDYVYFVTTAPFAKSLITELKAEFPERIGGISPLTKTQQAYLSLLIFYEEIYKRNLTASTVKSLLEKSLGLKIGDFINHVSKLPKISISAELPSLTIDKFGKGPKERAPIDMEIKSSISQIITEKTQILDESSKKEEIKEETKEKTIEIKKYPPVIEDILLFMYKRTGRFKWQTTYSYLKGKLINYRDEEVKKGFKWLENEKKFVDKVSSSSIKLNDEGINLLKKLNKI
ncbi:MAG: hypothetical protein ACTSYC_11245, partial [Promethearchaeota archaeon]